MKNYYTTKQLCKLWGVGDKKCRQLLKIAKDNNKLSIKTFFEENLNGQKFKNFAYRIKQ